LKIHLAFIPLLAISPWFISCAPDIAQPTVATLDVSRYAGEWHEVARLPNPFEKGLVAAKAIYTPNQNGTLNVRNLGLKSDGALTSIEGSAKPADPSVPGKLIVRFYKFPANLFAGDYWILDVNSDYTRALIGSPNLKYLWILDKNPYDKSDYESLIRKATSLGYETDKLYFNPKRITD